jgi:predicted DsbA family dithiol-disulfide isomerase
LWLAVQAVAATRWRMRLLDGVLWLTVAALTFSAGLVYVQFGVLHAVCPFCLVSAAIVVLTLPVALVARRAVSAGYAGASPAGALMLSLFAAVPAFILAMGTLMGQKSTGGIWLVDLAAAHRVGPADAPVQVVVYSDFQCEFCRRLVPVLQQVRSDFPQEVAIYYRHYPLPLHPRAFPAAVASECAAEQGVFWEYHDKLFSEGGDLSDAKLLELAGSVGLDQPRFTACLKSDRPGQIVEGNLREAERLGLPGAPCVFINGRRVEGALTHERLAKEIRELR